MHSVLPGMLTTEAGFSPGSSKHTEQGGPAPLPPRQGAGGDRWGPSVIFFPSRESLSKALNAKADCSGSRACSRAPQHPMAPLSLTAGPRGLTPEEPELGVQGSREPLSLLRCISQHTSRIFLQAPPDSQGQDLQEGSGICVCDELPGAASRTRPRGFSFTPTPASHFEGMGLGRAPRGLWDVRTMRREVLQVGLPDRQHWFLNPALSFNTLPWRSS